MRIRIQQTFGAHAGRVLEWGEPVLRIGRHPDNDVAFHPHVDLDASAFHAELRFEDGEWVLIDAGSRNGTWRKGKRVSRRIVKNGDEYEFGPGGPRLLLTLDEDASASDSSVTELPQTLAPRESSSSRVLWIVAASLAVIGIVAGVIAWRLLK